MTHGRAQVQEVELAATRDGRITGLRARLVADGGAYPGEASPNVSSTRYMASGVYRIARVEVAWQCVATNTTPVAAYRGAGRPEATAMVERAVDLLAARLRLDPAEVRRRNLIPARAFPYTTATKARYDSGDYEGALDRVLEAAGYQALRAEQAGRRQRGEVVQLGIGLSSYVEVTGFGSEYGAVEVEPDGRVTARTGVSPHGQGHETAFAQLVSATLGVEAEQVRVVHSDTAALPRGDGTMGSRSLQVGGSAVVQAADPGAGQGQGAGRPPAGGAGRGRGRVPGRGPRGRRRPLDRPGLGRAGRGGRRPGPPAAGHGRRPGGGGRLRARAQHLPVRRPPGRVRGRHRDRPGPAAAPRRRRRRRPDRQPGAGRGAGAWAGSPRGSPRPCSRRSATTRTATASTATWPATPCRARPTCRPSRPSAPRPRPR